MRHILTSLLIATLLVFGSVSLTGCVVLPPRGHVRVWVPGYWAPQHVWVGAHWRYR